MNISRWEDGLLAEEWAIRFRRAEAKAGFFARLPGFGKLRVMIFELILDFVRTLPIRPAPELVLITRACGWRPAFDSSRQ